uniref:Uncharacterized protein n=1 Tax=Picea glauca TaxID=3330 RepID=A0A101LUB7_PICGL|nr:hypothetical protein ABT39_MTgene2606 [Picea glauca]
MYERRYANIVIWAYLLSLLLMIMPPDHRNKTYWIGFVSME